MTMEELIKKMPMCLVASYDPLDQTTPEDLAWLAQHEIDLFDEGEDSDIRNKRERAVCLRYMKLCLKASASK